MLVDEAATSGSEKKEPPLNHLPRKASSYGDPRYWDARFETEENYEWLKGYSYFEHLVRPYLLSTHSILELGCGNSRLSEGLLAEGVPDITCIDLSAVAVQRTRCRLNEKGLQGIQVIQADMLDLPFKSESFDLVIEKGTMDVLYVDSGDPWNPRSETVCKVMKMLKGVHRVLTLDGIFISISFGQPHFRRHQFEAPCFTWSVETKTFGEGFHYFFNILKKGRRSSDDKEGCTECCSVPRISLFHDELDDENFLFRFSVNELGI